MHRGVEGWLRLAARGRAAADLGRQHRDGHEGVERAGNVPGGAVEQAGQLLLEQPAEERTMGLVESEGCGHGRCAQAGAGVVWGDGRQDDAAA